MNLFQIILLAVVQGLTELLPVSSSAHVILVEKFMALDPTSPEMTFLLVMLHTGTMLAVIAYFWKSWKDHYFLTVSKRGPFLRQVGIATGTTLILGLCLKVLIEKICLRGQAHAEVETLFGNLSLISGSLALVGLYILLSSFFTKKTRTEKRIGLGESVKIGFVQGLSLPFRGLSRSGATISTGLILGIPKLKSEEFSFALAVAITPFVLAVEIHRLWKSHPVSGELLALLLPGILGMVFSLLAGLLALKWLSSWLEKGRWGWFGVYCLLLSIVVWIFK